MKTEKLYSLFKKYPSICTDTRKIKKNDLFFALKGNTFNGNKFAQDAISLGCAYAIIDEEQNSIQKKTILVRDVLSALQALASYHRSKLKIPIIGITGTNGKTTSKELIKTVLSSKKNSYATKGNLNNHIGVPLSILEINKLHEIAIIEMGANHIREIDFLCNIAQPTFGVITNIGKAHMQGFGNLEGVIKAKTELYKFLSKNKGLIFVNNDDDLLVNLSKKINRITYGISGDYKGELVTAEHFISVCFNSKIIKTNLIGEYQFNNIMLAISIGKHFKVDERSIKEAIKNYIPTNNRSQIIETKYNTLILDAYNANPSSMEAMLRSFSRQKYNNKLCILGDMLELGKDSIKEHLSIINLCNNLELEYILIGEEFLKVDKTAFTDTNEVSKHLKDNPLKNKTILLKGSRKIALEELTITL